MAPRSDFNVVPLHRLSFSAELERVVILAERPDFSEAYALEVLIPREGPDRAKGLDVLWARVVTVAAAVVGTSQLSICCDTDAALEHIKSELARHPGVEDNLKQYGELSITRASADMIPSSLRSLSFRHRAAPEAGDCTVPANRQVYLGVDFGRSDVKVAVVNSTGVVLSKHVTRWWRFDGSRREFVDPQELTSHRQHMDCLAQAAVTALSDVKMSDPVVCGFGLSAAGCVRGGHLCGVPPAFGGVEPSAAAEDLPHLETRVLDLIRDMWPRSSEGSVDPACPCILVNDGDASALYGARNLRGSEKVGLFLSCGTGLAGGITWKEQCCDGVLELGKVVMGLRQSEGGVVPKHDGMSVEAVAQGMAGTQRSFFNLLAARGGEKIEGKAQQRAALVALQNELTDEVRSIFSDLGTWLAHFVVELNEYLPRRIEYVEVGGKLTDGPSGEIMLQRARDFLKLHGVDEVRRAVDSEFGQAVAMADLLRRPSPSP